MTLIMHSDWDYLRYVEQANGGNYFFQSSRCASTVSKFVHVFAAANQQMVLSLNCDPAALRRTQRRHWLHDQEHQS